VGAVMSLVVGQTTKPRRRGWGRDERRA